MQNVFKRRGKRRNSGKDCIYNNRPRSFFYCAFNNYKLKLVFDFQISIGETCNVEYYLRRITIDPCNRHRNSCASNAIRTSSYTNCSGFQWRGLSICAYHYCMYNPRTWHRWNYLHLRILVEVRIFPLLLFLLLILKLETYLNSYFQKKMVLLFESEVFQRKITKPLSKVVLLIFLRHSIKVYKISSDKWKGRITTLLIKYFMNNVLIKYFINYYYLFNTIITKIFFPKIQRILVSSLR